MEFLYRAIDYSALFIEMIGVCTIMLATVLVLGRYLFRLQGDPSKRHYHQLRIELGKGILLGLEILVAGDIIATVVTDATMERILGLAVIVLIRTFLSWSIQLEVEGRFPWQDREQNG